MLNFLNVDQGEKNVQIRVLSKFKTSPLQQSDIIQEAVFFLSLRMNTEESSSALGHSRPAAVRTGKLCLSSPDRHDLQS